MDKYRMDLQMDRLHLTNKTGLSDSDLEIVLNSLQAKGVINVVEFQKYRNSKTSLLSRVTSFLDSVERKGPDAIALFYFEFKEANNGAYCQLPSKSGCEVDGLTPRDTERYPEPDGSEIYCEKLTRDIPQLTNSARLSDTVLQQLVQHLTSKMVFNKAEKEKYLTRNQELHWRVTEFLGDVRSKGRRSCRLFYEALELYSSDVYTLLPSNKLNDTEPMMLC